MKRNSDIPICTRGLASMAKLAAFLLAVVPAAVQATDVRLVNYVEYAYSGNSADLMAEGVQNFDPLDASDALRLELWAFTKPHVAGMAGLRLAKFALAPLDPGAERGKIDSGTVPFVMPPNGVWYFAMLLTEYAGQTPNSDGFVERNAINFPTPEYIGVPPPSEQELAIEFYHAGYDHYFVAASAQEVIDLDTGVHAGWTRTGYSMKVWDGPGGVTVPVCRYYIPPGYGDSHFFSAAPDECAIVLIKFPQLIKETDAAFYIGLPDRDTGECAANEIPVYRLWNGRTDSNHRYTTSAAAKAAMIAAGYVAEGYGPDQVGMCAPL
jgi:hypothetical protein